MIQTLKQKKNLFTNIFWIFLIILFFGFLFFGLNIINSGYHIQDDHEILYYHSIINKDTFFSVLYNFLETDGRFRPVYWIHRVLSFYLFKSNFFLYYFEFFILGILSSIFLFFVLKKISKNGLCSIILLCFMLFGPSLIIFLGLGYGELLSLFLLSISLFFMTLNNKNYKNFNQILSLIFLTLCMFSKEQFLIAVPFVLLFKIIYDSKENSFKNALKSNILYVSISSILLILGIILNFYFVGNLSSAPYLINLDFNYIIKSTSNIINLLYIKIYLFELLLFLLVILLGFVLTRGKEIKKYSIYIFITFLFLMSQLIFLGLTPNNSIQFRYLFPAFLAPVLLLSSLFNLELYEFFSCFICLLDL